MALLELTNVTKYYGGRCVIKDLSFAVHAGEKIGLIGRNGCGKTTLLRMIAGIEEIDDGTISKANGVALGYLRQQDELAGNESLSEAMQQVFAPLISMENSLRKLEAEMARPEVYEIEERLTEVSARYARLSHEFEAQGGYTYPSRIKAVLFGLGFRESQLDQPLVEMSGGQRMRAALAKILLTEPDMLLLDEPTNHLDLDAAQWLEEYLKAYKGAVLVVSHDRYFLDRITIKIVEIDHEEGTLYRGNYSAALRQKEERLKLQAEEYRRTIAERAKLQDYIRRFQYGTRATMAQSRMKMLARLKPVELPKANKAMHMSFAPATQSGTKVLYLEGISKGFDHRLFGPVETVVERGERIAIVGPNGSGKSTLLSVITGIYEPDEGSIRWGTGVEWGYFRQGLDDLNDQVTVMDEMLNCEEMTNEEARTVLGRFLFSGEDVFKRVGNLSGGERSRLTLAKLFILGANLLILDEPTNHLDIPAKEALESALVDFPGTVIFVSHDRYFIDQVATRVWEIKDTRLRLFDGGYSLYQGVLQAEKEAAEAARNAALLAKKEQDNQAKAKNRADKAEENSLAAVEEEISQLEAEKTALEQQMTEPGFYQDESCKEKVGRYNHVIAQLEGLYHQWEQVSDAMS